MLLSSERPEAEDQHEKVFPGLLKPEASNTIQNIPLLLYLFTIFIDLTVHQILSGVQKHKTSPSLKHYMHIKSFCILYIDTMLAWICGQTYLILKTSYIMQDLKGTKGD